MILAKRARLFIAAAALATTVFMMPASAQEISDAHLQAAHKALDALNATDEFDNVLPQATQALKAELIQKNPDLVELINATVEENALKLAPRRADLEKEAALAYARVFSEEELESITTFYTSPAGQKLLSDGPIVAREVLRAAEIWQRGVARDLAQNVGTQIQAAVGAQVSGQPVTPAEGTDTPAAPEEQNQ
ncbi:hypothetical protein L598_000100002560 [Mesorhizobium sp. J18]|uniref:DUF2059 domain-containing protein n=1 Tax=Mesorhizobium sp. J18 TaxID=935263 RepID=UPI00119B700D|nr:DUF2059 domain-containing protein [Mesorhizobium sp. J18]TWH01275.1 hypothetical protein L598_000100002560 [Mesorhizobium sp. J18]